MQLATTRQGLHSALAAHRSAGLRIGFVPTMGNLHAGHMRLITAAKAVCDIVVASIFVNPTQFGVGEDFESYPRTLEADSELLQAHGCDILFVPTVAVMYGCQQPNITRVIVDDITDQLCGVSRPGHFAGVALVVSKLFNMVQPQHAFFGEKDYQQLAVIRALTADLCFDIQIHGVATERAADGLALSSRNGYLSATERQVAPAIYQSMQRIANAIKAGERDPDHLSALGTLYLQQQGFDVDYVALRTPELTVVSPDSPSWVILVAAKLGKTRLIDNMTVTLE